MSKEAGTSTFNSDEVSIDGLCISSNEIESDHDDGPSDDEEDDEFSKPLTKTERKSVPATLPRDAEDYKMDHPNRGHALIFNHKSYSHELCHLPKRDGTSKDRDNLKMTLKALGFEVHIFKNFSVEKIDQVLNKYSAIDHTDNDCILIAVLTHGKENGILYANDKSYKIEKLWEQFTADNCPTLAGKPKIILSQACRGEKRNIGVNLCTDSSIAASLDVIDAAPTNVKLVNVRTTYSIPTNADIILASATVDGYVAFKNQENGAVFIRILCEELVKDQENREFLNILTTTNRRIAIEYESQNLQIPEYDKKKQVSCFISMLTRNLYFKSKQQPN